MAIIHLIDGEKGGVGKSLVARTLVQYCLDRKKPFVLVETDRSNPDVGAFYQESCQYAIFSENERQADKADRIFEMAVEKPVIVNLAAQSFRPVQAWIERNNLFELGKSHSVSFCKWFVCTGGYDSIKLFVNSVQTFESRMPHILVRNLGLCDDWEHVMENDELKKLVKKYKVKVIDFPKLAYRERNIIDEKRLSFAVAREDKEFGVVSKQRIVSFLKAAYSGFEMVGMENHGK